MARGKKRREVRKEERVEPTPETAAKLTPDPLRKMIEDRLIGTEEERAAYEIRQVFMAICRGLFPRGGKLGEEFGLATGKPREMPTGLAIAHHETYLPWTKRHHPEVIDAVLTVTVDSQPVGLRFRLLVAESLRDYAEMMGRRKVVDISTV